MYGVSLAMCLTLNIIRIVGSQSCCSKDRVQYNYSPYLETSGSDYQLRREVVYNIQTESCITLFSMPDHTLPNFANRGATPRIA